jgi:hypothetical protein
MTSFSSLEFDKLFNASGNDKIVYYTDKIYGYKDFNTGFKDMVNIADYLKPITKISVNRYNKDVINQIIDGTLKTAPQADNKGWERGNGVGDTLVMNYALADTLTPDVAETILNDLIKSLGNPSDQNVKANYAKVATDHRVASNFMENVILSVCKWKYENAKSQLLLELTNNKDMISDVLDAGNELKMMGSPKEGSILANLHETASKSIRLLIKDQAPSTYRLDGFVEGANFQFNKFRTTLREVMFQKLVLKEYAGNTTVPDQVLMYMRRLLVELYIISFYPHIHFQYITELLHKFRQEGNFINMRVAALVRVAFTINTLLWYYQQSVQQVPQIEKYQVVVTEWSETLKNYMTALSRIDFKNKDATIQNVIADLHTLSSKVSSQSLSVDELKENIVASQIQVRSIISRLKQVNAERAKKATQFGVLVFLLLLIVVVSAVLLIFNMFKNYLLYTLVGICSIIILYKLVVSIMDIIKIAKQ